MENKYYTSMIGQFAVFSMLNGQSWAWRLVSTQERAEEIVRANKRKQMTFKKIETLKEANDVDFMIQKYEDWASDCSHHK